MLRAFSRKKRAASSFAAGKHETLLQPAAMEPSPEVIQKMEEEFPEEDTASKREHYERIINATPADVFSAFGSYVWRQNAKVTDVEIIKDSKTPGELEPGMVRRTAGYEEEIITVSHNRIVEYRILDGLPTTFHKSRILFMPEDDGARTRVIWTIWWSPTSMVSGFVYTVMMKGFCNLALYRLEQHVLAAPDAEGPTTLSPIEDTASTFESEPAESEEVSQGDLKDGEMPSLQWAARMQTGYEGNLTQEQEQSLADLRQDLQANDKETWQLCLKHPDGPDRIMLRFLRAECHGKQRKFNVEKSKKRLAATLKFRRDVGADDMITHVTPPKFEEFTLSGGELLLTDREGRIVVFTRAGLLSTCLDVKMMTEKEWQMNLVCATERRFQIMRETSKKLGHEVSATVIVYDVRGLGFASRRIIPFTKMINEIASTHYPEAVDMIIVAFAPAIFTSLFAMVKGFLDPVTASKVKVFGTTKTEMDKMAKTLRGIIDPANLPREFGGDNSDVVAGYPSNYKGEKFPIMF